MKFAVTDLDDGKHHLLEEVAMQEKRSLKNMRMDSSKKKR